MNPAADVTSAPDQQRLSSDLAMAGKGTCVGPHALTMQADWEKTKQDMPNVGHRDIVNFRILRPWYAQEGQSAISGVECLHDIHIYHPKHPYGASLDVLSTRMRAEEDGKMDDLDTKFWERQANASQILEDSDTFATEITSLTIPETSPASRYLAIRPGKKIPSKKVWEGIKPEISVYCSNLSLNQKDINGMKTMTLARIHSFLGERMQERASELTEMMSSAETQYCCDLAR
ncbi:hypothetical protein QFC20_007532 [Naganishia adeliensis]|uniref:Uncharacterized protein n=1 Tax=Naganishia adeliensis TaxID=92952 RepID=A0ACC2UZR2_9TREE|nr:hypothetical protein QFC20_007532 [Naganishia adeliensis]